MNTLEVLLVGALNDFLPPQRRGLPVSVSSTGNQTYKHLIESLGVPHPEIARIQIDGNPADLNQIARPYGRVEVFPYATGDPSLRPASIRFVLDGHLGKLASYLRILGFDVNYRFEVDDAALAAISQTENRILLTRDRGLLKRNQVRFGYCVRDQHPKQQLCEVFERYNLSAAIQPFTRCPKCNGPLHAVEKESVASILLPDTLAYYDQFWQCADCGRVYWQGSHYMHLRNWMRSFLSGF